VNRAIDRAEALAAVARTAGRSPAALVEDDPATGFTRVLDPPAPPLDLIEGDIIDEPGVLHFDLAPGGPLDGVPEWRGFLVYSDSDRTQSVVQLGERKSLRDHWPSLLERLSPPELACLIARYHGRDAGLPVHHTVVRSLGELGGLMAQPDQVPSDVAVPSLRVDDADATTRLEFDTAFLEEIGTAAPSVGLCHWVALWDAAEQLTWHASVTARGMPSIFGGSPSDNANA
jgi:hypothetical protein